MSVSIIAVYVGLNLLLASRAVLGDKKYEEWKNSNLVKYETNFKDANDLQRAVKSAKFDAIPWGQGYKTHITPDFWFRWSLEGGRWYAVFSKYADTEAVRTFFKTLQRNANRQILTVEPQTQTIKPVEEKDIPTIYEDADLLKETLQQYEAKNFVALDGENFQCEVSGILLKFTRGQNDEPFNLHISENQERDTFQFMQQLDESYCGNVQEKVYMNVKQRLEETDMKIESEEILDDNSIVLTISV